MTEPLDEPGEPPAGTPAAGTHATSRPPRRRWPFVLAAIAITPLVLAAVYTLGTLGIAYSEGDRAGYLQKFSRRGWLCKTYEGELAMTTVPGTAPTIWAFSVRDDSVARAVNAAIGQKVVLHYTEHRGVPTDCFAQTDYYVDAVRIDAARPGEPAAPQ